MLHVNDALFLTSVSHDILHGTADAVDNLKCSTLEINLQNVVRCYAAHSFYAVLIHLDIQFKSLKDHTIVGVKLNVVIRGENAPIIERFHRLVQERCRCYYAMLPFNYLPL